MPRQTPRPTASVNGALPEAAGGADGPGARDRGADAPGARDRGADAPGARDRGADGPGARSRSKGARSVKMAVTGPAGVGKTTLIGTISEITVLSTQRKVADHTNALKAGTTVAMDFGRLTIDRDLVLYLFGMPGQRRLDFMWEILAEGMIGVVVLVDAADDGGHDEAEEILAFLRERATVPYVVAVNKVTGEPAGEAVARVRSSLRVADRVPVVACDARDKESVKDVLLALLRTVLDEVDSAHPAAV